MWSPGVSVHSREFFFFFLVCALKSFAPKGCWLKFLIGVLTAKLHENAQPLSTVPSINKITGNSLCICVTIIPQFLFCPSRSSCFLQVSCLHDLLVDLLCHHLLCYCSRKNKSPENITVQTKHPICILCTFSQTLTNGELGYNHKFPPFLFTTVQIHIKNLVEFSYPPWGYMLPSVWFPVVHFKNICPIFIKHPAVQKPF